jgi:mono/diheme cytochrome c family protein
MLLLVVISGVMIAGCETAETPSSLLFEEESPLGPEVPEQYSGLSNPYIDDQEAITAGETLFEANCSSCHGTTGEGDGPASAGLNPGPSNLAARQDNMSDEYLYWRIAEGGLMEPFNSIMPGWRGLLDEQEIWQIIAYIRTMLVL